MPTLQLSFPVWVRYVDDTYQLQPLLFNGPEGASSRYEKALRKFRSEIIKQFRRDYELNRENLPTTLWYLFQPDYQYKALDLGFKYGNRYFNGSIGVAWFHFFQGTVLILPSFDRDMFLVPKESLSTSELADAVVARIQILARRYRKEHGKDIDLVERSAGKGEHCTSVQQSVFVREEKVSFQSAAEQFFFQFFRPDTRFEGRIEVHQVGHSLNGLFPDELTHAYEREDLVESLSTLLYNRENVPLVLLGPRKSGKTAILHEAVHRYLVPHQQHVLHERDHIWYVDPTRLIAGMSMVGAWQRRLESIIAFAQKPLEDPKKRRRDALYFDNVIALFRVGKSAQNSMTLSDVLKPYLQKRTLQVVLEATPEAWDTASELDRSFTDLFQVLRVDDPGESATLRIVAQVRSRLEKEHPFHIDNTALLQLMALQRRFTREESFIGRVAENLHQLATKYRQRIVSTGLVMHEFNQKTHFNPLLTDGQIILPEDELPSYFSRRLIGQPQVVGALVHLVEQIKAQMHNPQRPYGSFLFIGPTGVGKTEAAKVLAEYLFTHSERLLRFDMNEFIDPGAISRLVGDAFSPEGQLTSKVRHNPFCVLLFDEIEKAHPDVHDLLLQVLDEGRLTDALGQVANFRNTVIIMTSNLGADRVGRTIRFQEGADEADHAYRKAVSDFFRPEFINRIGHTLIFQSLTQPDIERIAHLQIQRLFTRQGFTRRKVILNVVPEVLSHIARRGFDPKMGGRALKRQIERDLVGLLADQLVDTPPDHPLLIDLLMSQGQIDVQATPMLQADPLPQPIIPAWEADRHANITDFEFLLEKAETLSDDIEDACDLREEESEDDLLTALREDEALAMLFNMKEDIREIIGELHEQVRQFGLRRNLTLRSGHFQVKTLDHTQTLLQLRTKDSADERAYHRDQSNREQVDDFLQEMGQAVQLVQEGASLYLHHAVNLSQLHAKLRAYQDSGIQYALLRIRNRSNSQLEDIDFLRWLLFRQLDGDYQAFGERVTYLWFRGPGILSRLRHWVGFHVFKTSWQGDIPLQTDLAELNIEQWQAAATKANEQQIIDISHIPEMTWQSADHRVLRNYYVHFRPYDIDKQSEEGAFQGVFRDLRTEWFHNLPISKEDWNLMEYAYLTAEMRIA